MENVLEFYKYRSFASQFGTERQATAMVDSFFDELGLRKDRLEEIKIIVAEACLNAIEHGNNSDPSIEYEVKLYFYKGEFVIRVYDHGVYGKKHKISKQKLVKDYVDRNQDGRGFGLLLIQEFASSWRFESENDLTFIEIRVQLPVVEGEEYHACRN